MSNTCYFCKREYDEHSQQDIDNCISKFTSRIVWKGLEES